MDVGVGLAAGVPGAGRDGIVDWAQRAEATEVFASVGVVDRVRYDNYDPLVALAAAAAVTERVQLVTSILIAPLREVATLAKQVVSLDALSGGRVTLGMAIGARGDDYDLAELGGGNRGERLTDQLGRLRELWDGGDITPSAARRDMPRILVGGLTGSAYARMARLSDGFVHNGGPPRVFAKAAEQARAAWADAGRPGRPQLWGMGYFALGGAEAEGRDYLLDYYAFTGSFVQRIADGLLTTPLQVRELVQGYAEAGCDHLVLFPTVADLDQVELLAQAVSS